MDMKHYRSLDELTLQHSWLTVGVFDGAHRGHQQIIHRLVEGAHEKNLPAVVLTFDPHPSKVFGRGEIKLLTLPDERAEILGGMGVDVVITHPFNREVANITARDFMQRLKSRLGLVRLILGYDSALGKDREGTVPRLTEIGAELGTVGKIEEAAKLMSRPYRLQGVVIRGDQRGRTIGFPTANLDYSDDKLISSNGIYACWAKLGNERFKAAVNIGFNPTFTPDKKTMSVEAYLLDFDRDIYDENLQLEFVARLRDELKFESVEMLVEQILEDVKQTRILLRTA
jgi:riboflavin kinase/FMN adenylyltransferase